MATAEVVQIITTDRPQASVEILSKKSSDNLMAKALISNRIVLISTAGRIAVQVATTKMRGMICIPMMGMMMLTKMEMTRSSWILESITISLTEE